MSWLAHNFDLGSNTMWNVYKNIFMCNNETLRCWTKWILSSSAEWKPLRQRLFVNQRICGWMAARRYECWVWNYSSMIIIAKTSYQWVALSAMKPAAWLCRDFMYASKTGTDRLIILQNVLSWLVLRCCVFTVQCRCIQHTEISYRKTRLCGTEHMKKISSFLSGKW